MRAFIAIPLPEEVKDNALLLQEVLDKKTFRLVKRDNLEMTIAFLGEIDEKEIPKIINKLEKIRFDEFKLKTNSIGFFPSENKIRVVWIGLEKNEEFMRLQHDIRALFDFKEKLMPHITIARARELIVDKENHWKKKLSALEHDEIEFTVDRFILFESVPGPEGHVHKVLSEFLSHNLSKS